MKNVKINKKSLLIIILAIVVVLAVTLMDSYSHGKSDKKTKHISVIVYGNDSDRWENLKQGAVLACEDNNADVSLVAMLSRDDYNEQIELIKREVSKGADGILLAACDSKQVGDYLNTANIRIPIVMVESDAATDRNYTYISADNYDMGVTLGKEICERENPIIKAAVIRDGYARDSIEERARGLNEVLTGYAGKVVIWERNENEENISPKAFLQRKLTEEAVDVIVALDNETADALMDALENLNMKRKVYAISTSDKSVYYLDQERIKALEYQSEFGIGYIGASYALDKSKAKRKYGKEGITYRVVDDDNMYNYENQTLLFPFVK